jgi:cobalamin-dependent methionine synthase I
MICTLFRKHGAAVVVMAFDEQGQAATEDEKAGEARIDSSLTNA